MYCQLSNGSDLEMLQDDFSLIGQRIYFYTKVPHWLLHLSILERAEVSGELLYLWEKHPIFTLPHQFK